jgi:hypothetical protein
VKSKRKICRKADFSLTREGEGSAILSSFKSQHIYKVPGTFHSLHGAKRPFLCHNSYIILHKIGGMLKTKIQNP